MRACMWNSRTWSGWEDIAANGYPSPETGVLWEEARDAHLERLAGEQPRVGPRSSWWSPR
ncbi:hypothetical protein [Streptomyces sp. T12]|uniref:hypothetical protein n=1 Tax=Streptomyces sp. T12 TaxID=477697 RepID=UPI0011A74C91|nr:hypothetical protein [Streptomyces sp. T12]